MMTRFYLCTFLAATILACSSALETKDEVVPLVESRKPAKVKLDDERDLEGWWGGGWEGKRPTKKPTKKPTTRMPTKKPTKKPGWWYPGY
ncbi:hypothetical protein ACHAW5_000956 [Stephanodiscus triporus]|uniref:Secreted protein n=1 Tax=Stephanodiscus triporus TaxID=2934178 RepID=A0ABD3N6F4_9STRA